MFRVVRQRHPDPNRRVHGHEWSLQQPVRPQIQALHRPAVHHRNRLHRRSVRFVSSQRHNCPAAGGLSTARPDLGGGGRQQCGVAAEGKVLPFRAGPHADDVQRSTLLRPTATAGSTTEGGENCFPTSAQRGDVSRKYLQQPYFFFRSCIFFVCTQIFHSDCLASIFFWFVIPNR